MGEEGGRRKKESETQNVRSHDHSIIYMHVCYLKYHVRVRTVLGTHYLLSIICTILSLLFYYNILLVKGSKEGS